MMMMMTIIIIYRHILHLHMTCLHSLWRTFFIFSRSEYTDELTVRRKFCIASGSCTAVCAITFRGVIRVITTVCVVFFLVVTHLPCKTLWDFFFFFFSFFFFSFLWFSVSNPMGPAFESKGRKTYRYHYYHSYYYYYYCCCCYYYYYYYY